MSRCADWLESCRARAFVSALPALLIVAAPDPAPAGHWAEGFSPPGTDAKVEAFLEFEGRVFIGGSFTFVGHVEAARAAIWDPSLDPASRWSSAGGGFDGTVRAFAEHQGQLFACGEFHDSGGITVNGVARWDGSGWQPVGGGLTGDASCLASYGGDLYAVGWSEVRRWNGSAWQQVFAANGSVHGLLVHEGRLLVYGHFSAINGIPCRSIVTWDGSVLGADHQVPGPEWDVPTFEDLIAHRGELIAAGYLRLGDPASDVFIALWNGSAWEPMDSPPPSSRRGFLDLACAGDDLFASGCESVGMEGPSACWLSRWDGAVWEQVGDSMRNAGINEIYMCETGLWVGGTFTSLPLGDPASGRAHVASANVALLQGDDACHLFPAALGTDHAVGDLSVCDGQLLVAGSFMAAGDIHSPKAAAWNGQSWSARGNWVYPVRPPDYLAGMDRIFTLHGSLVGSGELTVSMWDPPDVYRALWLDGGWIGLPWMSSADFEEWHGQLIEIFRGYAGCVVQSRETVNGAPYVLGTVAGSAWDLSVWGEALVTVGQFTGINGVPCNNVAVYADGIWSAVGGGAGNSVYASCAYGDDLAIGGSFTTVGVAPAARIARWDGAAWWPLGAGISGTVRVLLADGPYLIAGGSFTQAGGLPAANIAVWDGERWWPLGAGTNGPVNALELYQGDLYVGGEFTRAGGRIAGGIARWVGDLVTGIGSGELPFLSTAITAVAPNPFNPRTEVRFRLERAGPVEVVVYDLCGRRVATLERGRLAAGEHRMTWDGTNERGGAAPSGVYLVRLMADREACSRKVVLIR